VQVAQQHGPAQKEGRHEERPKSVQPGEPANETERQQLETQQNASVVSGEARQFQQSVPQPAKETQHRPQKALVRSIAALPMTQETASANSCGRGISKQQGRCRATRTGTAILASSTSHAQQIGTMAPLS
jgi:hypothetical protein